MNPYGFASSETAHRPPEILPPQVVILTDSRLSEAVKINSICHEHDISFIRADVRGVFGSVFCDFGETFEVIDTDGMPLDSDFCMTLLHHSI